MFEVFWENIIALVSLAWLLSLVSVRNKLLRPTASGRSLIFFLLYVLAGVAAISVAAMLILGPYRPLPF
jgi:hypothetical protein